MARIHVMHKQGGWTVVLEDGNGGVALEDYPRQRDAVIAARGVARDKGGGEVVVHRLTGENASAESITVSDSATVSGRS